MSKIFFRVFTACLLGLPLFLSTVASAKDGGESAGLAVGTNVVPAKSFLLPVVNNWNDTRKWGPKKWVGDGANADEKKKLVVVSFFATWCEPCKKEMPELVRLYNTYKDEGLGVMLVSIDDRDKTPEVVKLTETNEVKFPVLHDRYKIVQRRWEAKRLPYLLMLGPDGNVKVVHVGYTDEVKANLENEVRANLGLPALAAETQAPEADKAEDDKNAKKSKKSKKSKKKQKKSS
jgi:thiol-disulfide isomerase/thioredoxin